MADNKKKKATKNIKKVPEKKVEKKPEKPQKNENETPFVPIMDIAWPYILMVLAVILAIYFVAVRVYDITEGAGLGYAVQSLFGGLLGSAAYVLPLVIFYIGIKKCIYNFRWSHNSKRKPTAEHNPSVDRRRITAVTVSSIAFVFILSVLFGVINNYDAFSFKNMWLDGAGGSGEVYGGVIGSGLGMLLVYCCGEELKIISYIILSVCALVSLFFATGLSIGGIISYIQDMNAKKKEAREYERAEALRLEKEAEEEARKHKNRLLVAEAREEERKEKTKRNMSTDELLSEENNDDTGLEEPEIEYKPLNISGLNAVPSQSSNEIFIGIDGKIETLSSVNAENKEENVGEDFGGDPTFDTMEYSAVQGVLDGLQSVKQSTPVEKPAPEPKSEELVKEEPQKQSKEEASLSLEKMENEELLSEVAAVAPEEGEEDIEIITPYVFPPVDMLTANPNSAEEDFSKELNENAQNLLATLASFKVSIDGITYSRGPTITRYELKPAAGTRVRAIANLVDDIALSLATTGVRIEAPIPNKPAVGIEVPNRTRATVYLRDLIDSPKFFESKSRLTACLGMDVGGNPIHFDITKMPHLLIAGATGMGKSVCINTIIVSLLYKAKPDELKLILIDPKKVEFTMYKNIPHLYAPIVSDPKKAAGALASAVAEMERRFELIEQAGVRDISGYNATIENDPDGEYMPHMVIIIDELADLMMTAPDDVENSICRLAQKARAAGIHIIIGTQRPSVDVITGLIKANIPSRIACTVASQTDSRTILDIAGAEKLIGRGDMLFAPVGASKPMRVQGAFVSEGEVEKIVSFIRDNNAAGKYNAQFVQMIDEKAAACGNGKKGAQQGPADMDSDGGDEGGDPKFNDAVILAIEEGKIATSLLQRKLGVGYGRAAKIIDAMEAKGYVSKADGTKPRRTLISMDEYMRRKMASEDGFYDEE